ncbi:uncharacterized protein [Branchiostoma lanceolatum]|uniref:uncharacterized protein n=1 Tax=Branchiostoma lanceolatum TaxID=7740 RepID=UPI003456CC53
MTGSKTCWLLAVLLGCCCPWLTQGQEEEKFLAANFTEQPKDVMFDPFAEQEIRLPCAAKGEKPITYRWLMSSDGFTNFRALDLNSRQPPYEIDAGALIIKNPEKSKDERFYQCEAENKHGKVLSDPAAVKFAYVDEFDPTPRDPVSGRQGEGAVLRCKKPDAYPGLLFFWVESGALDPVFRSTDQRVYVSQKEGDLYIARTEPTDLGSYQCVIRLTLEGSQLREISPTNSFSFSGQASSQSAANLVLFEGATMSTVSHTTVVMEAFAYGNPIPTLTWRRLDAQGNEVAMSSRVTMEQFKRALTITNVQSGDAGLYEVTASNSLRSQTRRTQLVVNEIPHVFEAGWTDKVFRRSEGGSVTWDVAWPFGSSSDPVQIIWLHNARALTAGGKYRMTRTGKTASLQITDLVEADSGSYQCSIRNEYGDIYGPAATLYAGGPGSLRNFRQTESGDGYAVLGWDLPEGSRADDIGGYQVFVTPKGGGDTRIIDVSSGETSTRVDGLTSHSSNYNFQARANSKEYNVPGPLTDVNDSDGDGDTRGIATGSGVPLLAWLLPLLLLLLLFLLCCCCCLWLGLCGKYCPCCTCWTCFGGEKTPRKPSTGGIIGPAGMDKHHLEMLKLYQPDAVTHVKRPDRVTVYLASINVLPASVIKIINNQHTQDGYNRRIVESLTQYGGNEAFQGYCSSLRKEEKLYWLADTLEGRGLSVYRREQLMQHNSVLVEKMDPDITLAYLSKQRVFTTAMTEHVSSANSREEKNRRIIHLLQSSDDEDFSVFLDALRQNQSQAHLVELFGSTGQQKQQWNGAGQQKQQWNGVGQQKQQSWNITDQKINSTHVSSGVDIDRSDRVTLTKEGRGLSVYRREQLTQHQSVLVQRMDPDITLAYLSKQRVFTTAMTEHVSSANSREEKNRRIIHLLQSRDDDEFSVFLDALRQNQSQAHLVELFTGSGVYINQQSEQTARSKGLCFTDPSIKSGASAMVQIGQPVILEVNGEVDNAYWLLNDGPLPQNKGINVRKYGLTHELNIDGMTPELAGTYTCQGNTPDGAMLSCDINITSMEPKMMAL